VLNCGNLYYKKSNIYLVVKTIKSGNVDLSFQKSNSTSVNIFAKIMEFLTVKPHANIRPIKNKSLTYTTSKPLIIFYQLRYINMNILTPQGDKPKDVDLVLGDVVTSSSLF
jgi:hypothetical protein